MYCILIYTVKINKTMYSIIMYTTGYIQDIHVLYNYVHYNTGHLLFDLSLSLSVLKTFNLPWL